MNNLLITGGAGFVGANCALLAKDSWNVFITRHNTEIAPSVHGTRLHMNITDLDDVRRAMHQAAPKAVIHAAALSDTKLCAAKPELGRQVNTLGTQNIAIAAREHNARMIYISTDLVYDGRGTLYKETAHPSPTCRYGKTKLGGEMMVSETGGDFCIVRSATVYGKNINPKKCFAEVMAERLAHGEPVKLFTDEYRSFINVTDLCRVLLELAGSNKYSGIYNAGGPQRVSRYDFGIELAAVFGFDRKLIIPSRIDQSMFLDHRPEDCSMDISKLIADTGLSIKGISEGITSMFRRLK